MGNNDVRVEIGSEYARTEVSSYVEEGVRLGCFLRAVSSPMLDVSILLSDRVAVVGLCSSG